MAELLVRASNKVRGLSTGQRIKGKVVVKLKHSLVLDIGGKTEGVVAEKAFVEARDYIKNLKVGDEVGVVVISPETREGAILLSLREATKTSLWAKLREFKEKGEPVNVVGRSTNDAGIAVEIEGTIGFIPNSQLTEESFEDSDNLIGKSFKATIITIDASTKKLVLSEKAAIEGNTPRASSDASSKIKEGEIYEGEVTKVTDFGCFVRVTTEIDGKKTGVEGLVHVSEFAWKKIGDPRSFIKEGDKLKVKVIGKHDGKLAFSFKQAKEDPWEKAGERYTPETRVKGKVSKLTDFGVFVELETGIEGLIHMTKIPPATKLIEGQEVNCYVEDLDSKARKLSLGLVLTSKPIGYK